MPRIRLGLAMVGIFLPMLALAAAPPDASCRAAKLKAAGKYSTKVAGCLAKAAKEGGTVDASCVSKAAEKFEEAFSDAETKAGTSCNGLFAPTSAVISDAIVAAQESIPVPPGGNDCSAAALKASGKLFGSFLGAWSKYAAGDSVEDRDAAIDQAESRLSDAVEKAQAKAPCTVEHGLIEGVEDSLALVTACIGSEAACVETADAALAGEVVSTDSGSGATAAQPVTATVETPVAGDVVIRVTEPTEEAPSDFVVAGRQVDITAPDATASAPLVLTFVLDASLVPEDAGRGAVARNGIPVPDCTGPAGQAVPDPCIESRTVLPGGDLRIVALSSHASIWTPLIGLYSRIWRPLGAPPATCPTVMRMETLADAPGDLHPTELDLGWKGDGHDLKPASGSAIRLGVDCTAATAFECGTCDVTGFDPGEGNCRCAADPYLLCNKPGEADAVNCARCVGGPLAGHECSANADCTIAGDAYGCTYRCTLDRSVLCTDDSACSPHCSESGDACTTNGDCALDEFCTSDAGTCDVVQKACSDGTACTTSCVGYCPTNTGCECYTEAPIPVTANGTSTCFVRLATGDAGGTWNVESGSGALVIQEKVRAFLATESILQPCPVCEGDVAPNDGKRDGTCSSSSRRPGAACDAQASSDTFPIPDGGSVSLDCFPREEGAILGAVGVIVSDSQTTGTVSLPPAVACSGSADLCPCSGQAKPNNCLTAGDCVVGPDGEGACASGSESYFCDGILEPDGSGLWPCSPLMLNQSCPDVSPGVSAGSCTIVEADPCFDAAGVAASGAPDPASPMTVSARCADASLSSAVNAVYGLPGPVRTRNERAVTYAAPAP